MTPTQQLIAKLRECESLDDARLHVQSEGDTTADKALLQALATLKNSNPTVIAMLERAIGALEYMGAPPRNRHNTSNGLKALETLADLDALAREALKEKP